MIAFALLIGAIVVGAIYSYVRGRREAARDGKPEVDSLSAHRLKPRPEREAHLWEKTVEHNELKNVRKYILAELPKIELTDWSYYALTAITNYSPEFSKLLVGDELDLEFIKKTERNGINEAIGAVKQVDVQASQTLREYFHKIVTNLYRTTTYAGGDKFYWYGRDRVIAMLRSYQASKKRFMPSEVPFCDADGHEIAFDKKIDQETVKRMKTYFEKLQKKAQAGNKIKRRFKVDSENPVVEFDLERIAEKGLFKYNGSLVNSVYIDIRATLGLCEHCSYDGNWATTTTTYDLESSYFGFLEGLVMVSKYRGAVDNFADRVIVEFHDIPKDSWLIRWLKSYKLHLEGND